MTTTRNDRRKQKIDGATFTNGIVPSEQIRADGFSEELDALCEKYGVVINTHWETTFVAPDGTTETHSGNPKVQILIKRDWQPPAQKSAQDDNQSGD